MNLEMINMPDFMTLPGSIESKVKDKMNELVDGHNALVKEIRELQSCWDALPPGILVKRKT